MFCWVVGKAFNFLPTRILVAGGLDTVASCSRYGLRRHAATATHLPNFAQHFTTDFLLAGFAIAHHAFASAQDRNAQPV